MYAYHSDCSPRITNEDLKPVSVDASIADASLSTNPIKLDSNKSCGRSTTKLSKINFCPKTNPTICFCRPFGRPWGKPRILPSSQFASTAISNLGRFFGGWLDLHRRLLASPNHLSGTNNFVTMRGRILAKPQGDCKGAARDS
jgi:hypothetical protein